MGYLMHFLKLSPLVLEVTQAFLCYIVSPLVLEVTQAFLCYIVHKHYVGLRRNFWYHANFIENMYHLIKMIDYPLLLCKHDSFFHRINISIDYPLLLCKQDSFFHRINISISILPSTDSSL
jgi:hypothetical protein